jgi:serine/threonine protein kinase
VISVAGRCHKRFDFYARSEDGPRGPQGSTFFESQSCSLSLINLVKANILINESGHACLADFGLVAIISDGTSHASSNSFTPGGTFRWMSPELFDPENFGLKDSRRTERSDCYALGMVIYEVLSGQLPFSCHASYAVVARVLKGQRPERPQGAEREWFGNGVWEVLERCWTPKPDERPRIRDVLQRLEEVSGFWTPFSRLVTNPLTVDLPAPNSSDPDAEGSAEESEASSPSQSLQTFPQKGEADGETPPPTLPDAFIASRYEVTSNQDLGAYVKNRSESESLAVMDRVSRTGLLDDFLN